MNKTQLIIFFVAMIAVVILAINSKNNTSSGGSSTTNIESESNDDVEVGQYSCTSYHSGQADKLNPTTYEKNRIENEEAELSRLNIEIENTSVDEYSEYSVNNYNQKIRNYKIKLDNYNSKIADYNRRIEIYNSYFSEHCRKRY